MQLLPLVVYIAIETDSILHDVINLLIDSIHFVIIWRGNVLLRVISKLKAYCDSHLLIHKPEEELRENAQTNKGDGQKDKIASTNQYVIYMQRCHSRVDDSANGSFAPYGATTQFDIRLLPRMAVNVKWIALGFICFLLVAGEIVRGFMQPLFFRCFFRSATLPLIVRLIRETKSLCPLGRSGFKQI